MFELLWQGPHKPWGVEYTLVFNLGKSKSIGPTEFMVFYDDGILYDPCMSYIRERERFLNHTWIQQCS